MRLGIRQLGNDILNECFLQVPAGLHDLLFPFSQFLHLVAILS
jgi:hypothetical protein